MQKDLLKKDLLTQFNLSDIKPLPDLSLGTAKYHRAIYQGKSVIVRSREADHKTDFEQDVKVTMSQESNSAVSKLITTNTSKSWTWFWFTRTPSYYHMIMDDFSEISLHKLFQQKPLNLEERIKFIKQVVSGLEILHESQQYFPKLCARNIFWNHKEVKMTDFSSLDSSYISSLETSCYIAPEILEQKKSHTSSTDIYACGMLLLAILLWREPEPTLLSQVQNFFPQNFLGLKKLVQKCCDRNAHTRPTTEQLLNELNTILYHISYYSFIKKSPDNGSINLSFDDELETDAYFNLPHGEKKLTPEQLNDIKESYGEQIFNRIRQNPWTLTRSSKNTISWHAIYCEQEFYPTQVMIFTPESFKIFDSNFFRPPGAVVEKIGNIIFLKIKNRDLFIFPIALLWKGNDNWILSLYRFRLLRILHFIPQPLVEIIADYYKPKSKRLIEFKWAYPRTKDFHNEIFSKDRMLTLEQQLGWEKEFKALAPQFGILEKIRHYILEDKLSFSSELSQLICSYIDEGLFEKISGRIQDDDQKSNQSVNLYSIYTEPVAQSVGGSESGLRSLYNAARFLSGILYPNKKSATPQFPEFGDFKQWVNHHLDSTGHTTPAELTKILNLMADDKNFFPNFGTYLQEMQELAGMPAYSIFHFSNSESLNDQVQLLANIYRLSQLAHTKILHIFFIDKKKHWHVQFLAQEYRPHTYRFIHMDSAESANSKTRSEIDLHLLDLLKNSLDLAHNLAKQMMPDFIKKLERLLEIASKSLLSLSEPFFEASSFDFLQTFQSQFDEYYQSIFWQAQFLNECKLFLQDNYFQREEIEIKSNVFGSYSKGIENYYNVDYHGKNLRLRVENAEIISWKNIKEDITVRQSQTENPYIMQSKFTFHIHNDHGIKKLMIGELIDNNCSLYERLKQKPVSLKERLEIAMQIASGLNGLHQKNIIYTKLFPWHIFLDSRNRVRMIDFARISLAGTMIPLNIPYIAPEMMDSAEPVIGTDIYNFGMILFIMILWFCSEKSYLPTLKRLLSPFPLGLDELLERCLRRNPNERPSAIEIKSQLQEISDQISSYVLFKKSTDNSSVYISCDTELQSLCYFNFLGGKKALTEDQLWEIKISFPTKVYEQILRNPYCLSLDAENKVSFHAFHCRKELYPTMIMIFTTEVFELYDILFYLPTNTEIQRLHTLVCVRIQNQDLFLDSTPIFFKQKKMQPQLIKCLQNSWLKLPPHRPSLHSTEYESSFFGNRYFPEPIYSPVENKLFWKIPKPERTHSLSLEDALGWENEHKLMGSEFSVLKKIQDFILEFLGLPINLSSIIFGFILDYFSNSATEQHSPKKVMSEEKYFRNFIFSEPHSSSSISNSELMQRSCNY